MLTPISVRGTSFCGVIVEVDIESFLSGGMETIATLPNSVGRFEGINPDISSLGVYGCEDLLTLLLRVSPTDWFKRREHSGGRKKGSAAAVALDRS
jgi:hypothetical protein